MISSDPSSSTQIRIPDLCLSARSTTVLVVVVRAGAVNAVAVCAVVVHYRIRHQLLQKSRNHNFVNVSRFAKESFCSPTLSSEHHYILFPLATLRFFDSWYLMLWNMRMVVTSPLPRPGNYFGPRITSNS
ncbi:hypothetical protein QQ045_017275 [Rhodiola kirilowii]